MSLEGKVALVTGAGRGIGRAIALRLARDGAGIVAVARSRSELEALQREISRCWIIAADLTDPRQPERVIAEAVKAAGRLDVLVNNAGMARFETVADTSYEHWREMFALNMEAVFLLTRAALPVFKGQGAGQTVNIGSDASLKGIGRMACYCATKFALRGFSLALREELRQTGIRINLILPGGVNTTILDNRDHPELIPPSHVAELVWQVIALAPQSDVWEILLEPKS
jgi:3-oxoacyl-[acyl-carrier protein] reductase